MAKLAERKSDWGLYRDWIALAIMLGLGFIIRYYMALNLPLAHDEEFYLSDGRLILKGLIPFRDFEARSPLFVGLVALFLRMFGMSVASGRMLAVLSTTGVIPMVYLIGRELKDRQVGLIAAAIYGFNPLSLMYGYVVNTETVLILFISVSMYLLLYGLKRQKGRALILAGVILALSIFIRRTALVFIAFEALFAVLYMLYKYHTLHSDDVKTQERVHASAEGGKVLPSLLRNIWPSWTLPSIYLLAGVIAVLLPGALIMALAGVPLSTLYHHYISQVLSTQGIRFAHPYALLHTYMLMLFALPFIFSIAYIFTSQFIQARYRIWLLSLFYASLTSYVYYIIAYSANIFNQVQIVGGVTVLDTGTMPLTFSLPLVLLYIITLSMDGTFTRVMANVDEADPVWDLGLNVYSPVLLTSAFISLIPYVRPNLDLATDMFVLFALGVGLILCISYINHLRFRQAEKERRKTLRLWPGMSALARSYRSIHKGKATSRSLFIAMYLTFALLAGDTREEVRLMDTLVLIMLYPLAHIIIYRFWLRYFKSKVGGTGGMAHETHERHGRWSSFQPVIYTLATELIIIAPIIASDFYKNETLNTRLYYSVMSLLWLSLVLIINLLPGMRERSLRLITTRVEDWGGAVFYASLLMALASLSYFSKYIMYIDVLALPLIVFLAYYHHFRFRFRTLSIAIFFLMYVGYIISHLNYMDEHLLTMGLVVIGLALIYYTIPRTFPTPVTHYVAGYFSLLFGGLILTPIGSMIDDWNALLSYNNLNGHIGTGLMLAFIALSGGFIMAHLCRMVRGVGWLRSGIVMALSTVSALAILIADIGEAILTTFALYLVFLASSALYVHFRGESNKEMDAISLTTATFSLTILFSFISYFLVHIDPSHWDLLYAGGVMAIAPVFIAVSITLYQKAGIKEWLTNHVDQRKAWYVAIALIFVLHLALALGLLSQSPFSMDFGEVLDAIGKGTTLAFILWLMGMLATYLFRNAITTVRTAVLFALVFTLPVAYAITEEGFDNAPDSGIVIFAFAIFVVFTALAILLRFRAQKALRPFLRPLSFVLLWLLLFSSFVLIRTFIIPPYFLEISAGLSIGVSVAYLVFFKPGPQKQWLTAVFAASIIMLFTLSAAYTINDPEDLYFKSQSRADMDTIKHVGAYIRSHTSPDEEIFAWPTYGFASDRDIILNMSHALSTQYTGEEVRSYLDEHNIRYVVLDPNLITFITDPDPSNTWRELSDYLMLRYRQVWSYNEVSIRERIEWTNPVVNAGNGTLGFYFYDEDAVEVYMMDDINAVMESIGYGEFYTEVSLPYGTYHYVFKVEDRYGWTYIYTDPFNPLKDDNGSYINVPFEIGRPMTSKEAKNMPVGSGVKVSLQFIYHDNITGLSFGQDESGGMALRIPPTLLHSDLIPGQRMMVIGNISEAWGIPYINVTKVDVTMNGSVEPMRADPGDICQNPDQYLGTYVTFTARVGNVIEPYNIIPLQDFNGSVYPRPGLSLPTTTPNTFYTIKALVVTAEYIKRLEPVIPSAQTPALLAIEPESVSAYSTEVVPIASARVQPDLTVVVVKGTITSIPYNATPGGNLLFIQDETAGIAIYVPEILKTALSDLKEGDAVEVTGHTYTFNGLRQINISSENDIRYIGLGESVRPTVITTAEDLETYEGRLVQITGTLHSTLISTEFYIEDEYGTLDVYIGSSPTLSYGHVVSYDNATVRVIGILAQFDEQPPYDEEYEIWPRYFSDILPVRS